MPTVEKIYDELREVYDPEIPVNVVDLGLIYEVGLEGSTCNIQMTLTTQACPEARTIPEVVKRRVSDMDGVEACNVEIVWEPMWTPHRISEKGREILGLTDLPPEPEPAS